MPPSTPSSPALTPQLCNISDLWSSAGKQEVGERSDKDIKHSQLTLIVFNWATPASALICLLSDLPSTKARGNRKYQRRVKRQLQQLDQARSDSSQGGRPCLIKKQNILSYLLSMLSILIISTFSSNIISFIFQAQTRHNPGYLFKYMSI